LGLEELGHGKENVAGLVALKERERVSMIW
jgi:hypothetical protein